MDRFHREYTKVRVVGKGSFGEAVLCTQNDNGEQVVVKRIKVKMDKKEEKQALNEVTILSRLKHPNIVRYIDNWIEGGVLHIVMEYADGGDIFTKLRALCNSRYRIDETVLLDWFIQMCSAMRYLHDQKILHRDLKTQNIFLTSGDSIIKLGDFGIAKTLQNTADNAETVVGTPFYLSPEICASQPYNSKSDVWALGVVLYELMTYKHPFTGNSIRELVSRIQAGCYTPVEQTSAGRRYSPELATLLRSMLSLNPAARPSIAQILRTPLCNNRLRVLVSSASRNESPEALRVSAQRQPLSPPQTPGPASARPCQAASERVKTPETQKHAYVLPAQHRQVNNSPVTPAQSRSLAPPPVAQQEARRVHGPRTDAEGLPIIDLDEQIQITFAQRQRALEQNPCSEEARLIAHQRDNLAEIRNKALLRVCQAVPRSPSSATSSQEAETDQRNADLLRRVQSQRPVRPLQRASPPPPLERPFAYGGPRHPSPVVNAARSVTPPPAPRVLEPLDAQPAQPLEFDLRPRSPRASPPSPLQRRPSPVAPPPAHPVPRFRQESPPPVNAGVRKARDTPGLSPNVTPSPRLAFAESKLPRASPLGEQYRAGLRKDDRKSEASPSGLGICANLRAKARVSQVTPTSPPPSSSKEAPRPARRQYSPITRFMKVQDLANVSNNIMNAGRESPQDLRNKNSVLNAGGEVTNGSDTNSAPYLEATSAADDLKLSVNGGNITLWNLPTYGDIDLQEADGELHKTGRFGGLQIIASQSSDDVEHMGPAGGDVGREASVLQSLCETFADLEQGDPEEDDDEFGEEVEDYMNTTLAGIDLLATIKAEEAPGLVCSAGGVNFSIQSELLRQKLEEELGLDDFMQGYRLLSAEADGRSSIQTTSEVKALLGPARMQNVNLIRLLLHYEQNCFSPEAQYC